MLPIAWVMPADHNGEHTHIGADPGESAVLFPLLLVRGQGGQQRPVGNIVDAVGDVPEKVGNGKEDNEAPASADVAEKHQVENGASHAAYQDCRLEFAPGRMDVVNNQAGNGVVQGIEDFGKFGCNALDGVKVVHLYVLLSFDV